MITFGHMVEKEKEWFVEWFDSTYYHILYGHRDEKEAQGFLDRLLVKLDIDESITMLDLACGKGRHAVHLATKGHHVHGVDLSQASIAHCKQFESESLTFAVGDMREVYKPAHFDLILNLFTSFGYFEDLGENKQVIEAIASGLKPGGLFVIDFLNVIPIKDRLPESKVELKEGVEFAIEKRVENGKIFKEIAFQSEEGKKVYIEQVQALTFEDFKGLLTDTELELHSVFGSYELSEFDPEISDRLILVGGLRS